MSSARRLAVVGADRTAAALATGLAGLGHDVGWADGAATAPPRVSGADFVFVCGAARSVVDRLGSWMPTGSVVVNCCVPPWHDTAELRAAVGRDVPAASHPLNLRAGRAAPDVAAPDRIVVGAADERTREDVLSLYAGVDAPVLRTGVREADVIAAATDAYCVLRQEFFDQLAGLCAAVGVGVDGVVAGLRPDERIDCDVEPDVVPPGVASLLDFAGEQPDPVLRAWRYRGTA
ncbi:hypothetical protein [Saccharopolyspora cebuensis]|uniref:Pyrroline-5-carboxylate reductase catalytic N-terminal domain-containing protein n=1 Tax=Saccharopolyspora cebuensis TaxID=418759 RepID=A0ABV4CRD8_9PSEU